MHILSIFPHSHDTSVSRILALLDPRLVFCKSYQTANAFLCIGFQAWLAQSRCALLARPNCLCRAHLRCSSLTPMLCVQTARKSTGGKAPRKQLATKVGSAGASMQSPAGPQQQQQWPS